MAKGFNLRDWILYNVITVFMTEKEWHSFWRGFFAGISFSQEGRYMKKIGQLLGCDHEKTDVKRRDFEMGYSTGEWIARVSLVLVMIVLADQTGACKQVITTIF